MLMVDEKSNELYYAIAVGENAETLRGLRVPLGEESPAGLRPQAIPSLCPT